MKHEKGTVRRQFLKGIAAAGGAAMLGGALGTSPANAAVSPDWKNQVGLELFTIGREMNADFEGCLAKVAAMGYKEVEPAGGYNNMEPKAFRTMLDRYGLTMPSTHSGARGTGADLEKQLEGFQVMGIQYTEVASDAGGGRGGPPGGGAGRAGRVATPLTEESVKRSAQAMNENGKIVRKFGMKILIHNHTGEFEKLANSDLNQYDVLLRETDPALVAMQLDIGWASVAGKDILVMFKKNPGRYELWHVKDAYGITGLDPKLTPGERQKVGSIVPVGLGEVDYKAIFAAAELAGMKHYCIEQDSAAQWGNAMAAVQVSISNLRRILS